jgi:2-keto-4-pentenoate hydratase
MPSLTPAPSGSDVITPGGEAGEVKGMSGGRRTRGASVKALKKMLKKAGLKTTGKKAALTRRAKKAHLKIKGGENGAVMQDDKKVDEAPVMGGRRRSRRSRGFKLF